MNQEELAELIANRLQVPVERIRHDSDLLADLGADSLTLAALLGDLEERLSTTIRIDDLLDVSTVGDLQKAIEELSDQRLSPAESGES